MPPEDNPADEYDPVQEAYDRGVDAGREQKQPDIDRLVAMGNQLADDNDRLRKALAEIADATQKWTTGVGSYTGGETNAGFASRLKGMARDALQLRR